MDRPESLDPRDHRRLGPALDLFHFSDVSPGAPFWHPKGMIVLNELAALVREEWRRRDYLEVRAPVLMSAELWKRSGHMDAYRAGMFFSESEGRAFAVKPMNCPGHCVIFGERPRSWRDLPLRYAELSPLHRNELSGSLAGLKRVRAFAQDDAHIFCREDQVEAELLAFFDLVRSIYDRLGLPVARLELSGRPASALGDDESWRKAEAALRGALAAASLSYEDAPGEGAFYGPKVDFHVRDGLGRLWQCATVQVDRVQPARFGLEYHGKDNRVHVPVMLHRAALGSFERMVGILVEHWDGAFPPWLAPEQVRVLPVSDAHASFGAEVVRSLRGRGLRASLDLEGRLPKRIALAGRVPFVVVVGDREVAARAVSVRGGSVEPLDGFGARVEGLVRARARR